jgi:CheY-like chemotaxis protein
MKTVLIVDDEPQIRTLVKVRVQSKGYGAIAAEDGQACLSAAIFRRPDAILLDIMMPEMDGYETLKCLKENAQTCDIPVIMFSAQSQNDHQDKAAQLGAAGFIPKPLEPELLFRELSRLC